MGRKGIDPCFSGLGSVYLRGLVQTFSVFFDDFPHLISSTFLVFLTVVMTHLSLHLRRISQLMLTNKTMLTYILAIDVLHSILELVQFELKGLELP